MKILSWLTTVLVIFGICPFAYGYDRYGSYGYRHPMMPWGWGGGLIMVLIGLIVVAAIICFVFRAFHYNRSCCFPYHSYSHSPTEKNNALEILKKRYAQGEITKVEYEQIKKDLEE